MAAPSEGYLSLHACHPHRKSRIISANRQTSRAGNTGTKCTEQNLVLTSGQLLLWSSGPPYRVAYGDVKTKLRLDAGRSKFRCGSVKSTQADDQMRKPGVHTHVVRHKEQHACLIQASSFQSSCHVSDLYERVIRSSVQTPQAPNLRTQIMGWFCTSSLAYASCPTHTVIELGRHSCLYFPRVADSCLIQVDSLHRSVKSTRETVRNARIMDVVVREIYVERAGLVMVVDNFHRTLRERHLIIGTVQ